MISIIDTINPLQQSVSRDDKLIEYTFIGDKKFMTVIKEMR
jgi:hypothetical protein